MDAGCPEYSDEFSAKVYKITRDDRGERLTHLKVCGGSLKSKMLIGNEKVNQIRVYAGDKFTSINEAPAGTVCAVTGLSETKAGQFIGAGGEDNIPVLEPVLNYKLNLPAGADPVALLSKLRTLEEEEPELHVEWDENFKEIHVSVMGPVLIEVLTNIIRTRFGVDVTFGEGSIVYKETIKNKAYGIGHFEPLRHYAEVHLLLEPGESGSGMRYECHCSEDILDKNWQRLVYTHLCEKMHRGVLTGSELTDMKITLVAGRAHPKHTEGGDFRQATYRAVRQGRGGQLPHLPLAPAHGGTVGLRRPPAALLPAPPYVQGHGRGRPRGARGIRAHGPRGRGAHPRAAGIHEGRAGLRRQADGRGRQWLVHPQADIQDKARRWGTPANVHRPAVERP